MIERVTTVVSMGTEDRRPAESTIPGTETVYEFVVFRFVLSSLILNAASF